MGILDLIRRKNCEGNTLIGNFKDSENLIELNIGEKDIICVDKTSWLKLVENISSQIRTSEMRGVSEVILEGNEKKLLNFKIAGMNHEIIEIEKINYGVNGALGYTDESRNRIYLEQGQERVRMLNTFIHEVVEVWDSEFDLNLTHNQISTIAVLVLEVIININQNKELSEAFKEIK